MPYFSQHSEAVLNTCDKRLREVFREVVRTIDCRAISGKRNALEQNELFRTGKSKAPYPMSYHNTEPLSKGIDIVPYPIDWSDRERFTLFAGVVQGIAISKGYTFTWGGDWDRDFKVGDNNYDDMAHFQVEDDEQ